MYRISLVCGLGWPAEHTTTPGMTTTTSDDSSESMSTTTGAETPGFGLILDLLVLIGGAVLARD